MNSLQDNFSRGLDVTCSCSIVFSFVTYIYIFFFKCLSFSAYWTVEINFILESVGKSVFEYYVTGGLV